MRTLALLVFSLAALASVPAAAQDIPTRVGRLAFVEGDVAVYQDPEIGWDQAYLNTPLTSENSLWTDRRSRAELRVSATAIRLDEYTQLDVAYLDEDGLDANLESGSLSIRVRHHDRGRFLHVDTREARFTLLGDGRYRIDRDADRGESRLTVFSGEARLEAASGAVIVPPGRAVVVWTAPDAAYTFEPARSDAFDRWAASRDAQWTERVVTRYLPTDMTGYEDLDRYGEWRVDAELGPIWYPVRVPAGWVPYRTGRWVWIRPWGWTWVDEQPWGFAPFHYGRWVELGGHWGWVPGPRSVRPVWAPALVAWVGGSDWSVTVSGGNRPLVGWYPLAPWERYQPWYRASPTYVTHLNVIVREHEQPPRRFRERRDWREWNRDHGATVVHRETITERRPVQHALVRVPEAALRQQTRAKPEAVLPSRPQPRTERPTRGGQAAPPTRGPAAAPSGPAARSAQPAAPLARPDFARGRQGPAPTPAARGERPPASPPGQARERPGTSPLRRGEPAGPGAQAERPSREAQQRQQRIEQEARQREERSRREAQQQQERSQRETQQQQQRAQQEARQRAQHEAQQQQQRAQQEARQREAQQRARQEARQRAQQEARQRAQHEAQQQQQRAQQEARQREAQQRAQQEARQRAQHEAQQQQQRAQQEARQRAQHEAQQQQQRAQQEARQRAQHEAQQQQQRAQQEARQREAQQRAQQEARQRAQHEAQQQQQRAQQEARQRAQHARENKGGPDKGGPDKGEADNKGGPDKGEADNQGGPGNRADRGNRGDESRGRGR